LAFIAQDDVVPEPALMDFAPRVDELPTRNPATTTLLFLGEYVGLARHATSETAFVAWNLQRDEANGIRRSDAAVTLFDATCPQMLGLSNGTSHTDSPLVTCSEPSTAIVDLGTFSTSLGSLCEMFPLCGAADDLQLELTATLVEQAGQRPPPGGERQIGSANLIVQAGHVVQATDVVTEALGAGSHVVSLCASDVSSGQPEPLGCLEHPLVVTAPLGSVGFLPVCAPPF
jgi:hypothetical protein